MFLVTGATGNVGSELVKALLRAHEDVRALTRNKRPPKLPPAAQSVPGDLDHPETLAGALAGAEGVFLLPGYKDMPGVMSEIQRAGVTRVVLLSGGSAAAGDTSNAVSAYMIASETAVRESGVAWTILRPSAFMSNALRWVPQLLDGDVIREPFASVVAAVIDPADVAAVAATALRSEGHAGQTYTLSGPEPLLPADRVRILGQVLERPLRLDPLSNEQARAQMSSDMPPEYVKAFFSFYVDGTLDESPVRSTVQQILGRPPRTFEQWAQAHAFAFR